MLSQATVLSLLRTCPLFASCKEETLSQAVASSESRLSFYEKGLPIGQPLACASVGVLLQGTVSVGRSPGEEQGPLAGGESLPLNELQAGEAFGYAELFSKSPGSHTDTVIRACEDCEILWLPEPLILQLMEKDSRFSVNLLGILTDKIRFLNRKIAAFTASTAEETLKLYLESRMLPDGSVVVPGSMTALALRLHLSRASLYRAMDSLIEQGKLTPVPKDPFKKGEKRFRYQK